MQRMLRSSLSSFFFGLETYSYISYSQHSAYPLYFIRNRLGQASCEEAWLATVPGGFFLFDSSLSILSYLVALSDNSYKSLKTIPSNFFLS